MPNALPYVSAALICEKVLQEPNGSLSLIRLADQVQIEMVGVPAGFKPGLALNGLIALKSGNAKGKFTITIDAINPKNETKRIGGWDVELQGNDHGANLILNLNLGIEHAGLYWFDVRVDGTRVSMIPLTIVIVQPQQV